MAMKANWFQVRFHEDGTFTVYEQWDDVEGPLRGAELEAWLADMEQRIAQARSRS